MSRSLLGALILFGCLASSRLASADEIQLKDGTKITGEVIASDDDSVQIRVGPGTTSVPRSRIKKIVRVATPAQQLETRRKALAEGDVAGRVDLARFCIEESLPRTTAAELALEAWALEPANAGSVEVLGQLDYKFEGQVWVAPVVWYPAHDYVRRGNGWMTNEVAAYTDALDALTKARVADSAAKKSVDGANDELKFSNVAKDDANAKLQSVLRMGPVLDAEIDAAQADLTARENDLSRAATPITLSDGSSYDSGNVPAARTRRDHALRILHELLERKAALPGWIADARAALAGAEARIKGAAASIELAKTAWTKAGAALAEATAAEARAKKDVQARNEAEHKAEVARADELLRFTLAQKAPAPALPAPGH